MSSLSRMFMFSLAAGIMISLNSWENKYVLLRSLRAVQILSFPTLVKKFESSFTIWRKIWDTRYLSEEESYNLYKYIISEHWSLLGFLREFPVWTTSAQFVKNSSYLVPGHYHDSILSPLNVNPYDLDFVDFRLFQCSFGREKVCLHST